MASAGPSIALHPGLGLEVTGLAAAAPACFEFLNAANGLVPLLDALGLRRCR
jgi:hypothetical protein